MLRIAIANDSLRAIDILRRVILSEPGYEIAWIAKDGAEAVKKRLQDPPDLLLMDLVMPVMDGVTATSMIMKESPTPILIVTATISGNAGKVLQAMGFGALDVVPTPVLGPDKRIRGDKELLAKIARISRFVQKPSATGEHLTEHDIPPPPSNLPPLIAIGSSAGGPKALATILAQLPRDFSAAIVVVQHVDAEFASRLTEWLRGQSAVNVELAEEGSFPTAGTVFLVRGDRHLIMNPGMRLSYVMEPHDSSYWPSIDVFFASAAKHCSTRAMGILLTGMGRDGAQGLLELRRAGWRTIAQDEATSVVYGMPKAAVELGAADEVLPLSRIAAEMIDFAVKRR